MPIKDPTLYGTDWPHISFNIVFRRARGRCECDGWCNRDLRHLDRDGRCRNRHGQKRWRGKPWQRPVILSAVHLNRDPASHDLSLLRASCEACHLAYDSQQHAETRRKNREDALGLQPLF